MLSPDRSKSKLSRTWRRRCRVYAYGIGWLLISVGALRGLFWATSNNDGHSAAPVPAAIPAAKSTGGAAADGVQAREQQQQQLGSPEAQAAEEGDITDSQDTEEQVTAAEAVAVVSVSPAETTAPLAAAAGHDKITAASAAATSTQQQQPDASAHETTEEAVARERLARYNLSLPGSALIAVHISKTGGTTLDHVLQKGVGRGLGPGVGPLRPDCVLEKWMYFAWKEMPISERFKYGGCQIVSGEVDTWTLRTWVGEPETVAPSDRRKHFVTVLRDPYMRLLSQFDHNTHWEKKAMDQCETLWDVLDPASRCASKLEKVPGHILDKYRSWQVANVGDARHLADTFSFFGLTEHFYASLCLMYYTFRDEARFSRLCSQGARGAELVPRKNKKDPRYNYTETARDDAALKQRSRETNAADFALYEAAAALFKERVLAMEEETGIRGFLEAGRTGRQEGEQREEGR